MVRTRVGYAGGTTPSPTYRAMGDHTEALQVDYDPSRTCYEALLEILWEDHLPLRPAYKRQYRWAIFYAGEAQRAAAEGAKRTLEEAAGRPIYIDIEPLGEFTRAEDYHQKYALRRHRELLAEFAGYSPRELADSTLAARLNAYAYGHGTVDALAAELPSLGLSPEVARHLQRIVRAA